MLARAHEVVIRRRRKNVRPMREKNNRNANATEPFERMISTRHGVPSVFSTVFRTIYSYSICYRNTYQPICRTWRSRRCRDTGRTGPKRACTGTLGRCGWVGARPERSAAGRAFPASCWWTPYRRRSTRWLQTTWLFAENTRLPSKNWRGTTGRVESNRTRYNRKKKKKLKIKKKIYL